MKTTTFSHRRAFTIVEVLVVIVVLSILLSITVVSFRGRNVGARDDQRTARAEIIAEALEKYYSTHGDYPSMPMLDGARSGNTGEVVAGRLGISKDDLVMPNSSSGVTNAIRTSQSSDDILVYVGTRENNATICTNDTDGGCDYFTLSYRLEATGEWMEITSRRLSRIDLSDDLGGGSGTPTIADGVHIQQITSANCPTERTRAVDARDNHTYWVQELADGKCWMLTNLAYAGGGTNTHNDTKSLTNGTGSSTTYTTPRYYVVPSTTSFTTEPNNPSTSTNGTGQYGYLYNWCGAMGGQAGTAACLSAATPAPNPNVTVCPAGWRLPTGGSGGEFTALNSAVNSGATNTDAGLRSNWLAQRGGYWENGFSGHGDYGFYWSSTQNSAYAYDMYFDSSFVGLTTYGDKSASSAVRCVAS